MMHILKRLRRKTFGLNVRRKHRAQRGQGTVEYLLVIGTISAGVTLLLWEYLQPAVERGFLSLVARIINPK
jgi:hypothetical protein